MEHVLNSNFRCNRLERKKKRNTSEGRSFVLENFQLTRAFISISNGWTENFGYVESATDPLAPTPPVRFRDSASYMGRVCCQLSSFVPKSFASGALVFPKNFIRIQLIRNQRATSFFGCVSNKNACSAVFCRDFYYWAFLVTRFNTWIDCYMQSWTWVLSAPVKELRQNVCCRFDAEGISGHVKVCSRFLVRQWISVSFLLCANVWGKMGLLQLAVTWYMLEGKLPTGTSKTKRLHQDKFEFSLFWMFQWAACPPACTMWPLAAKGPLKTKRNAKLPDNKWSLEAFSWKTYL